MVPDERPTAVVDRLAEAFRCNLVTRQEYDDLFLSITRLTDRIEVLESKLRLYEPVKLGDIEFDSMVPVQRGP